ncbi:MAG: hypothetical protein E4G96_06550, partial [Chrysiogenales bacterium]
MKYARRLALIPAALAVLIMTFSCSDSEHRIPFGATRVVINMGLPAETPDAELGLIERIRQLFVPDAIAQSAPAAFSSLLVRVTGADIGAIEESFGAYGTITMNVPAGDLRVFEVTAIVAPGDPSAAASFKGTTSATLPAGATVNVPVVMGLNETKIVMPDPWPFLPPNYRIIQINDMTGAGYIIRTGPEISFAGNFIPWDIDYDAMGRIYIATNCPPTLGLHRVIRVNNINDTAYYPVADNGPTGVIALAIDRSRGYLYYASANALMRCNIDGTNNIGLMTISGIDTITGLSIDGSGVLYISGSFSTDSTIFRYDPFNQVIMNTYSSPNLIGATDVMVHGPNI